MNSSVDLNTGLRSSLYRAAAWMLAASLVAAAFLFTIRRLCGGFVQPAPARWIVLAGITLAAVIFLIRRGGVLSSRSEVLAYIPTLAAVVIGLSLWMPGSSLFAMGLFWVFLGFGEWTHYRTTAEIGPRLPSRSVTTFLAPEETEPAPGEEECIEEVELFPPEEPQCEQLTRSKDDEGFERIEGQTRISFEPGQRIGYAHVPFCPPFAGPPGFDCYPLAGPECRIKPTQVHSFGARIEARLPEDAPQRCDVWVFFAAAEERTA